MSNTAVIEKWVGALESGEYNQTTGALRRTRVDGSYSYCCLGVLCELAVAEGLIPEPNAPFGTAYYGGNSDINSEDSSFTALPVEVQEWVGLASDPPTNIMNDQISGERRTLVSLNDTLAYTFPQIAAVIRDTYLPASVTEARELVPA